LLNRWSPPIRSVHVCLHVLCALTVNASGLATVTKPHAVRAFVGRSIRVQNVVAIRCICTIVDSSTTAYVLIKRRPYAPCTEHNSACFLHLYGCCVAYSSIAYLTGDARGCDG
jgi:hypothetical protein